MKKLLGVVTVVVLIFWVVTAPASAATSMESLITTLSGWATNVTTFFANLAT